MPVTTRSKPALRRSKRVSERRDQSEAAPKRRRTQSQPAKRKATRKPRRTKASESPVASNQDTKSATALTETAARVSAVVGQSASTPWREGENDIRPRAAHLCRMLGELYRLRWIENDRFRMRHWYPNLVCSNSIGSMSFGGSLTETYRRRTADLLDGMETPLKTLDQVNDMIDLRGVGPRTVSVLTEIYHTGYVDWIDDLHAEVCVQRAGDDARSLQLDELRRRADAYGARIAERRAQLRERAEQRHQEYLAQSVRQRKETVVDKALLHGVRITGAKRREYIQRSAVPQREKEATEVASSTESGAPTVRVTRGAERKRRIAHAFGGAALEDPCAVCLEEYTDEDQLLVFECQHCFHEACIRHWLHVRLANAVSPSCPLCRRPLCTN
ncbi:MAG: hypothetical protein MHM6MM_001493 [Cercozoa sp. M6MM]